MCLGVLDMVSICLGRHFVLRTDHQAFTTLLSAKGSGRQSMRKARWVTRLLRFNYTVEYVPGLQNYSADALIITINNNNNPFVSYSAVRPGCH